jgi:hypothetical protein
VVPRGDTSTGGARLYVAINPEGHITFNARVFEKLGKPEAVLVMFDRVNSRIALKPTYKAVRNAYPVNKRGSGGRRPISIVCVGRLLVEYGLQIPELLEFKNVEIDRDGQLILDLRTARASNRGTRRGNSYAKKPKAGAA